MSESLDFPTGFDWPYFNQRYTWPDVPDAIHGTDWVTEAVLNHDARNSITP